MKKHRIFFIVTSLLIAFESFAIMESTSTSSTSGTGTTTGSTSGGCPNGASDCGGDPTTPVAVDPGVKTFGDTMPDAPIQFGVRDISVTSDGKCMVKSVVGPYSKSPCEKIYGLKESIIQASSNSEMSSNSIGKE